MLDAISDTDSEVLELTQLSERFPVPARKKLKVESQVKVEHTAHKCVVCKEDVRVGHVQRAQQPVTCDVCHDVYHLRCAKMTRPPKFQSWACGECSKALR
jgi:hypothetical protein